jgi:two-component system NtrC family sensor kinase
MAGEILEYLPQGVAYLNRDLTIRQASARWRQAVFGLGVNPTPILGRNCLDCLPGDSEEWAAWFGQALRERQEVRLARYPVHLSGSDPEKTMYWDITIAPVPTNAETPEGLLFLIADVTEQAQAEMALRWRNKELNALNSVAAAMSRTMEIEEILEVALEQALNVTGVPAGGIRLLDEANLTMTFETLRGLSPGFIASEEKVRVGECLCGAALNDGCPIFVNDLQAGPHPLLTRRACPALGFRSLAVVPLQGRDSISGVLYLASESPGRFPAEQQFFLSTLGGQIGAAVEQTYLMQRRLREAHELGVVLEAGSLLSATLDQDEVLNRLLSALRVTLEVESGNITLLEDDGSYLHIVAQQCDAPAHRIGQVGDRYPVTASPLAYIAVTEKRPVAEPDAWLYPALSPSMQKAARDAGLASVLEVPILHQGEVIGVVHLSSFNKSRIFSENEVSLAQAIATQAGIAIEHARLFAAKEESEARYRRLAEQARDIIFRWSPRNGFEYVNPAVTRITGYTPEEHYQDPLLEQKIAHPEDRATLQAMSEGVNLTSWTQKPVGMRWYHKDGRLIYIEQQLVPVYNADGELEAIEGIGRDVTERKKLEQQLWQAEKLTALGELIAGVAHELNNPLTTVIGFTQLLRRQDWPEKAASDLARIAREAGRCARIVKNLLVFARQRTAEKKEVDINQALRNTLELRAYRLRVKNIALNLNLDEKLPCTLADGYQLQQAFLNIINNAEQAMAEVDGARTLTIRTSVVQRLEYDGTGGLAIRIEFQDSGPGIPLENINRIFDPFFTTKPEGEGTGLGLSMCFGIVREHGGRIWAENLPGGGALFIIELPVVQQASETPPTPQAPAVEKRDTGHILLVDDEEDLLDVMAQALLTDGHLVESALSGEAALDKLKEMAYDMIIADVRMPGIDGPTLYELIRQRHPKLADHLLFITGDIMSSDVRSFLEESKVPYLGKPFDLEEFSALVNQMLQRGK